MNFGSACFVLVVVEEKHPELSIMVEWKTNSHGFYDTVLQNHGNYHAKQQLFIDSNLIKFDKSKTGDGIKQAFKGNRNLHRKHCKPRVKTNPRRGEWLQNETHPKKANIIVSRGDFAFSMRFKPHSDQLSFFLLFLSGVKNVCSQDRLKARPHQLWTTLPGFIPSWRNESSLKFTHSKVTLWPRQTVQPPSTTFSIFPIDPLVLKRKAKRFFCLLNRGHGEKLAFWSASTFLNDKGIEMDTIHTLMGGSAHKFACKFFMLHACWVNTQSFTKKNVLRCFPSLQPRCSACLKKSFQSNTSVSIVLPSIIIYDESREECPWAETQLLQTMTT